MKDYKRHKKRKVRRIALIFTALFNGDVCIGFLLALMGCHRVNFRATNFLTLAYSFFFSSHPIPATQLTALSNKLTTLSVNT
jgi:hypothetical protein